MIKIEHKLAQRFHLKPLSFSLKKLNISQVFSDLETSVSFSYNLLIFYASKLAKEKPVCEKNFVRAIWIKKSTPTGVEGEERSARKRGVPRSR